MRKYFASAPRCGTVGRQLWTRTSRTCLCRQAVYNLILVKGINILLLVESNDTLQLGLWSCYRGLSGYTLDRVNWTKFTSHFVCLPLINIPNKKLNDYGPSLFSRRRLYRDRKQQVPVITEIAFSCTEWTCAVKLWAKM